MTSSACVLLLSFSNVMRAQVLVRCREWRREAARMTLCPQRAFEETRIRDACIVIAELTRPITFFV